MGLGAQITDLRLLVRSGAGQDAAPAAVAPGPRLVGCADTGERARRESHQDESRQAGGPPNPTPIDADGNTADSTDALQNVLSGSRQNTASGAGTLSSNCSGDFNTAS